MTALEKQSILYDNPEFGSDVCAQLHAHHSPQLSQIPLTSPHLLAYYAGELAKAPLYGVEEGDDEYYQPTKSEYSKVEEIATLGDVIEYGSKRNNWSGDFDHSCRCLLDVVGLLMDGVGVEEGAHSGLFVVLDGYNHVWGETLYFHGDYFDGLKPIPAHRLSLLSMFMPSVAVEIHEDPEVGPR